MSALMTLSEAAAETGCFIFEITLSWTPGRDCNTSSCTDSSSERDSTRSPPASAGGAQAPDWSCVWFQEEPRLSFWWCVRGKKSHRSGHGNSSAWAASQCCRLTPLQKHLLKQAELHGMDKESEVTFCIYLFFLSIKGQFGVSRF